MEIKAPIIEKVAAPKIRNAILSLKTHNQQ